ncbi:hypothetical protein DICSQDRAFT_136561 [Dichomitus squalens LYAD-421 SS1]|uniref:Uncharacterized protein n=1 Tax=Dichomitus squalens (strain LYAD-421) TaxID=732165 RepID=R7T293_DICSQ|nr:uncharacterized protein DICSQDRAFT_136561 [Dichomitus squalens LYAD-421 SS1]EJF61347.1 hypothetical protein DICSQDRAFT_136561 [Dichomitus squalens LYAD-421 SS1]
MRVKTINALIRVDRAQVVSISATLSTVLSAAAASCGPSPRSEVARPIAPSDSEDRTVSCQNRRMVTISLRATGGNVGRGGRFSARVLGGVVMRYLSCAGLGVPLVASLRPKGHAGDRIAEKGSEEENCEMKDKVHPALKPLLAQYALQGAILKDNGKPPTSCRGSSCTSVDIVPLNKMRRSLSLRPPPPFSVALSTATPLPALFISDGRSSSQDQQVAL